MDFLKRQLFFIICGLLAALGVAVGVAGLKAMPEVTDEMQACETLYASLDSLRSNPVNKSHIAVEKDRIERIKQDLDAVVEKAKALNHYTPLVPGMFPKCELAKENEFRELYVTRMEELMASLRWGRPATRDDIEWMQDQIQLEERERNMDRYLADAGSELPPVDADEGPAFSAGMVLTRDGARTDAEARAHMAVAQSLRCYAEDLFTESARSLIVPSLEIEEDVPPTGELQRPELDSLWRAQLGLWIQTDVVRAINTVNEEAAQAFRASHRDDEEQKAPWVGVMPVKDVISVRMSDYVLADEESLSYSGDEAGGYKAADPPTVMTGSFTQSACTDMYEVLHFTVKLVMDQRDIPRLVDEICRDSFHTLLRISYKSVPPNRIMRGKIYGEEPVVNVVMDFETVMLGELFRPMMPDTVREFLGLEVEGD